MASEKTELNKGKSDWITYQERKQQSKIDQKADKEHNENINKRKFRKLPQPDGGFQLG